MTEASITNQLITDRAGWRDYLELCKPRVVALMILTAIVGMCLASINMVSWNILVLGNLGIGLSAASAAAINHLFERRIDLLMRRTKARPVAQGKIKPRNALAFAIVMGLTGMFILIVWVNLLTAALTFFTLVGYAIIYTVYLKHATSQNIVIGGLAGAAPPLLGWVAVTGHIDPQGLLLVLIIFIWTPPHFWALAIHRLDDYKNANIPMLPVTHGVPYTKINILFYTMLLTGITMLPFAIQMSGWIYLFGACILNAIFLYYAIRLLRSKNNKYALRTFWFSIWYLFILFIFLLLDHYIY
ncbi:MAG: heme o synthase [Gammaproteobacteria bacterium]|nr:heme o synthase [Gammaproteobacteria bacterium]